MSAATELERFAKEALSNESLRAEIKALGADQDAIIRLANSKGFHFSLDDAKALAESGELTDSQLAGVAGGNILLYTDGTTTVSGGSVNIVYKSGGKTAIWIGMF